MEKDSPMDIDVEAISAQLKPNSSYLSLDNKLNIDTNAFKTITANSYCLIRLPSEASKIVHLKPGSQINIGKFGIFNADCIIGHAYGDTFEIIDEDNLITVPGGVYSNATDKEENEEDIPEFEVGSSTDNKQIFDVGSQIQGLSMEEIEGLKKATADSKDGGRSIIEKVIQSHKAFDKKTIYSQQKYLRRKQQKFLRRFRCDYLGSTQLVEYFLYKDPAKILEISVESLGLMMNLANIQPGGRYLVLDDTTGLIVYSMMERMQGKGSIVLAHENEHPNLAILNYSTQYSEVLQKKMIKTINWLQFFEPENEREPIEELPQKELDELKASKRSRFFRRLKRAREINEAIDMVQAGDFDALVIATTFDVPTLAPRILDKVGGSRPIVIYNQFKESLIETSHALQKDLRVLAPTILETRVRPYQTIPGRLHPVMTMRGGGGYLLWGTRVYPREVHAVGRGGAKRKKQKVEERINGKESKS